MGDKWAWLTAWDEPESTEADGITLHRLSESFPAVPPLDVFDFDALMERDRARLDALLREVQSGDAAVNKMLDDMARDAAQLDAMIDDMAQGTHHKRAITRFTHYRTKRASTRK